MTRHSMLSLKTVLNADMAILWVRRTSVPATELVPRLHSLPWQLFGTLQLQRRGAYVQ